MQVRRRAFALLGTALGGAALALPSQASAPEPRVLVRAEGTDLVFALSGAAVVWSGIRRSTSVDPPVLYRLRAGRSRPIWRSGRVAVAPGERPGSAVGFGIRSAASSSTAAVIRQATLFRPGGFNCHDCAEPLFSDLLAGRSTGPLRLLEGAPRTGDAARSQHWVDSVAVWGANVVYSERVGTWWYTDTGRVVLLRRGRMIALVESKDATFADVQAAGPFVAWTQRSDSCGVGDPLGPCDLADQIAVYDRRAGRVVFRLTARALHAVGSPSFSFALQSDGKLAVTAETAPCGASSCQRQRLYWASPRSPQPRVVPVAIRSLSPLAISRNRIVYLRRQGEREILGVSDLAGRRTQLDAFDGRKRWFGGLFAVQGERVAWTASTKVASSILATRLPAPKAAG